MAIYTPNDIANMNPPRNVPDALVKGGYNFVCKSAPYLAGFAFATGNLPAAAGAAAIDIACGLPLIPLPDNFPPSYVPVRGGCRNTYYRVTGGGISHNAGCVLQYTDPIDFSIPGPIGVEFIPFRMVYVSCLKRESMYGAWVVRSGSGGSYGQIVGFPELGDYMSVSASPYDGGDDSICSPTPIGQPLPPGALLPPGMPDAPYLPGRKDYVPYLPPNLPVGSPPLYVPIVIPPVILPIRPVIAPSLSVPVNAPISIPVTISPSAQVDVSPSLTLQLDDKGNVRTPPDLICECPEPSAASPSVETETLSFYFVRRLDSGRCETVNRTVSVLPDTVPSDFAPLNLNTVALAQAGCEPAEPAVLAVPEYWAQRVGQRPQTSFVFRFVSGGRNRYSSLIVPFPKVTEKPASPYSLEYAYEAGSVLGMVRFEDGSRVMCYCKTEAIAEATLDFLSSQIKISSAGGIIERYVKDTRRDVPVYLKTLVSLIHFPQGRASLSPSWEVNTVARYPV